MELKPIRGSKLYLNPAIDLFSAPTTDISVTSGNYQKILPSQNVKDEGPIYFRIDKGSNGFLDMKDSFIYIKAKLKRKDGSSLTDDDLVAPVNLFLHSMFQNVKVKFNDTTVSDTWLNYPYQAWFLKQLTNGIGIKNSEMSQEFYFNDTAPDDYSAQNTGYQQRLELAKGSKQFEMLGRICDNIFDLSRYLLNNVTVDIELMRSLPKFCLSGPDGKQDLEYKYEIQDASLFIRRRTLSSPVLRSIQLGQAKGKHVYYPYQRMEMKSTQILLGSFGCTWPNIIQGVLPTFVCIGLVSAKAFNGDLHLSPFNFKHYNLTNLSLTIDDEPVVYRSIECDYDKNEFLLGYNTLLKATNRHIGGNNISVSDYQKGNVIYVLDIAPTAPSRLYPNKKGEMSLNLAFSKPLPEQVQVVLLAQFPSVIDIDKSGNVSVLRNFN